MSREQSLLRGITNKDLKQVVGKGFTQGWQMHTWSSDTHASIIWPLNDGKVTICTTASDRNAHKTVARKMEEISGIPVLVKVNHSRGRQTSRQPGYTDTYVPTSQRVLSKRVEDLNKEYSLLVIEFRVISTAPFEEQDYTRAKDVLLRLSHIEDVLVELHQPIPTPNLNTIIK